MAIDVSSELAKVNGGVISKPTNPLTIGTLELALLERFPASDGEPWDRTGLLAGDPAALVSAVVVALDPTPAALEAALEAKANVLLTHHPAFLEAPSSFCPNPKFENYSGSVVYEALSQGIALMNFHTALDVSPAAISLLPSLLSLTYERLLIPLKDDPAKGYGPLCTVVADESPLRLDHLAARCVSVFGATPRVWGLPATKITTVALANGSASGVLQAAVDEKVDCLIAGEVHYHDALAATALGLCIIELGHDISELPLCALLAQAAVDGGVSPDKVGIFEQADNWMTPDARRA